jgi:hypothetical protein
MKKLLCPQCKITRFNVKNESGDAIVVIVNENLELVPINPDQSLEGYILDVIYCLGCSWKGSPKSLTHKH